MENPPFEDVFPTQDGDFPLLCLFTGGYWKRDTLFHGQLEGGPDILTQVQLCGICFFCSHQFCCFKGIQCVESLGKTFPTNNTRLW